MTSKAKSKERPGWKDLPSGGFILEPGNATKYLTGDWRLMRPVWDAERCIDCLLCWLFCPDGAVLAEGGKITGFDYDYCKGCGICAKECPPKVDAIKMIREDEALEESLSA